MPKQSRRCQLEAMLKENPGDEFLEYGLAVEYLIEQSRQQPASGLALGEDRAVDERATFGAMADQALLLHGAQERLHRVLHDGVILARLLVDLSDRGLAQVPEDAEDGQLTLGRVGDRGHDAGFLRNPKLSFLGALVKELARLRNKRWQKGLRDVWPGVSRMAVSRPPFP